MIKKFRFGFVTGIFILCLFLSLPFSTNAFAKDANLQKDISSVQNVYRSLPGISANFTQKTYVALIDKTVSKLGKFYFKKGGRLRIEYEGDENRHYVSDGTTLWIYSPGDAASLQTYAVSNDTIPKEALAFLSGFGELQKEFIVEPSNAFEKIPNNFIAFHLKPRSKKAQYKSLDTLFNKEHLLVKLKIRNLSGNITDYDFSNIKTDANLRDDFFSLGSGKATPDTLPERYIPTE